VIPKRQKFRREPQIFLFPSRKKSVAISPGIRYNFQEPGETGGRLTPAAIRKNVLPTHLTRKKMSKSTFAMSFAAAAAVALTTILPASAAVPTAMPGDPLNFAGVGFDYSSWSLSFYGSSFTKNYRHMPEMEFTRANVAVGMALDKREIVTLYGLVGMLDRKVNYRFLNLSGNAGLFGLGFWFNLWQTDQLPVFEGIDSYSITAGLEGTYSKFDNDEYASVDGFLFFEIHGEPYKRAFIFPRSIGIYFGPVFSYSVTSDYDTTSGNMLGVGGGLNIRFTENINLKIGGEGYSNDNTVYGQFSINF